MAAQFQTVSRQGAKCAKGAKKGGVTVLIFSLRPRRALSVSRRMKPGPRPAGRFKLYRYPVKAGRARRVRRRYNDRRAFGAGPTRNRRRQA